MGDDLADLKTLKLASFELTEDALERFLAFQRALLSWSPGGQPGGPEFERRLALADAEARQASGLDAALLSRIEALCADFCGRRWTARELARRRERAVSQNEPELAARLSRELARLEDLSLLEQRHGRQTVERLRAREEQLLELHRARARVFGRAGQGG